MGILGYTKRNCWQAPTLITTPRFERGRWRQTRVTGETMVKVLAGLITMGFATACWSVSRPWLLRTDL